jgi:hypothetical protein
VLLFLCRVLSTFAIGPKVVVMSQERVSVGLWLSLLSPRSRLLPVVYKSNDAVDAVATSAI